MVVRIDDGNIPVLEVGRYAKYHARSAVIVPLVDAAGSIGRARTIAIVLELVDGFPGLSRSWSAPTYRAEGGICSTLIGLQILRVAVLAPATANNCLPVSINVDGCAEARREDHGIDCCSCLRDARGEAVPGDARVHARI